MVFCHGSRADQYTDLNQELYSASEVATKGLGVGKPGQETEDRHSHKDTTEVQETKMVES